MTKRDAWCWQGGCTAGVAVAGYESYRASPGATYSRRDEQAPQFLQERRMDGDVKIPI